MKTYDGCTGVAGNAGERPTGGASIAWRPVTGKPPPFESCCDAHDRAYAQGGSRQARRRADLDPMICIADRGYPIRTFLYYLAARIGGSPLLPFPWRWGFKPEISQSAPPE